MNFMNRLYDIGVGRWLWDLYRSGPMSLGFWGGLADAEVCARMTVNTQALDWMSVGVDGFSPSPACVSMILRSFESLSVVVQIGLYLTCICMCVATLRQWLVSKTMARTFAREFHSLLQSETKREALSSKETHL